jgi:hypothetical protein
MGVREPGPFHYHALEAAVAQRYMSLETIARITENANVRLSAVAA